MEAALRAQCVCVVLYCCFIKQVSCGSFDAYIHVIWVTGLISIVASSVAGYCYYVKVHKKNLKRANRVADLAEDAAVATIEAMKRSAQQPAQPVVQPPFMPMMMMTGPMPNQGAQITPVSQSDSSNFVQSLQPNQQSEDGEPTPVEQTTSATATSTAVTSQGITQPKLSQQEMLQQLQIQQQMLRQQQMQFLIQQQQQQQRAQMATIAMPQAGGNNMMTASAAGDKIMMPQMQAQPPKTPAGKEE